MGSDIDEAVRLVDSTTGDVMIREYATIHDSEIGDRCQIYERCSIKKSYISDEVDINAGSYVENADIGPNVQIGPNCSVVGVTHELRDQGMVFRPHYNAIQRIATDAQPSTTDMVNMSRTMPGLRKFCSVP